MSFDSSLDFFEGAADTHFTMEWGPENIRSLRRRLGWSQSDLARRMQIETSHISDWEAGKELPKKDQQQTLELIFKQAELAALEIVQSTRAEWSLRQRDLESIDVQSLDSGDND